MQEHHRESPSRHAHCPDGAGFVGCIIMEGLLSRGVDLTILVRSGYMVRRDDEPDSERADSALVRAKGVKILTRTSRRPSP